MAGITHRNGPSKLPGPPTPPTAVQANFIGVRFSGTDQFFVVNRKHEYFDSEGVSHTSIVEGINIVAPSDQQVMQDKGVFLQVNIIYADKWHEVHIVADHLVIRVVHPLPIAVVQKQPLVVAR